MNNIPQKRKTIIGITGITGGLGRRLGELLSEYDVQIHALVRKESMVEGLPPGIKFIYGDIRDIRSLENFIKEIDICIHLAAQIRYVTKRELFETNVTGTDNVCKAILACNPNCRLVHCSTISTLKVKPVFRFLSSTYGVSKYLAEKRVSYHMKKDNLRATIIYPGLIYGVHDRSFLPQIVAAIKSGKVKLFRGGERNAPLIHSDELSDLFIKAALQPVGEGKRYISVKGIELGIHDVVRIIAAKTNSFVSGKIYSKTIYFVLALLLEAVFTILKKKGKPSINRTVVDVLSINFNNYKRTFDDPKKDLGWEQNTSEEYFLRNISDVLAHRVRTKI